MQKEYVPNSLAVYERFEGYVPRSEPPEWTSGAKIAHFDRVEWLIIPDQMTSTSALRAGEVDWVESVDPDLVATLSKDSNVTVSSSNPYGLGPLMAFNHQNVPFNNVKLRRAI